MTTKFQKLKFGKMPIMYQIWLLKTEAGMESEEAKDMAARLHGALNWNDYQLTLERNKVNEARKQARKKVEAAKRAAGIPKDDRIQMVAKIEQRLADRKRYKYTSNKLQLSEDIVENLCRVVRAAEDVPETPGVEWQKLQEALKPLVSQRIHSGKSI